ncbi:hypothetical protein [Beijerinckia mobilis]|uniref:hypothetical protein n=1 Tax=Beijerinckia mobilis TaxID=231434 RepID=UPI00054CE1FA|nr:hypothetical protein [Beijerinckia mobilis]
MSDSDEGLSFPRRLLLRLAQAVVFIYLVLDAILAPLFQPIVRWFAELALIQRLERLIADLSPYTILILLAIPFVIAEPAKLYALYLIGAGHMVLGVATLIGAYLISLLVVDRIYQAGAFKLRLIEWFDHLMSWLTHYRDKLVRFVHSTAIWQAAMRLKRDMKEWFAELGLGRQ